jgi:hypothetical protein
MTYFLWKLYPLGGDLAQNKLLLGENWPIRGPHMIKMQGGVPCFLGDFVPFLVIF